MIAKTMKEAAFALCVACGAASAALAFPDGAPWGMDPAEGCNQCHFDGDMVVPSAALAVDGLPERPLPGHRYRLHIGFEAPDAALRGMAVQMFYEYGAPAGELKAVTSAVEAQGSMGRSRETAAQSWEFEWTAPQDMGQKDADRRAIMVHLWGNAANGDGSPFGDQIHHRIIPLNGLSKGSAKRP
ncbi:choice-of-anchor V domain-containing protein [Iodidimonas gelatinilytica]|nr:choice-of-anchor V domain-containing protein [Iodidimonas gelatinilytica]